METIEFEIKKTGTLKYSRLKSLSILRKEIKLYDYNYSIREIKELLDSILNKTFDGRFNSVFKRCFDTIFDNMIYIEYAEDEYVNEKNFPDNFVPPMG